MKTSDLRARDGSAVKSTGCSTGPGFDSQHPTVCGSFPYSQKEGRKEIQVSEERLGKVLGNGKTWRAYGSIESLLGKQASTKQ